MKKYILKKAFGRLKKSKSNFPIQIIFSNGKITNLSDKDPEITIHFKTQGAEIYTLLLQNIGFTEKYRIGQIDILGQDALRKLVRMTFELNTHNKKSFNLIAYTFKFFQERKLNNKKYLQEKKNLFAHYNMPAEFFHLMTGELYGYTEGYYETERENQNEAQYKKYDYMCRKLLLKPNDKVVEVGSAWGTMALLMADKYGCDVTNYGLIPEQNRIFESRVKKMGLENKIKNENRDCRELGFEKEKYDKYVSLGVLEHAGKDCLEDWIKNISECLKPNGIGLITNVGQINNSYTKYIIGKYIWRGCYFPTMSEVLELLEKYDLNLVDLEETHFLYANTMEVMLSKMLEHWDKIHAINPDLFDEKFKRIWSMYYIGSIEGFRSMNGFLHTFQYVFVKGRAEVYPKTRDFLYKKPFDTNEMYKYFVPLGQDGFKTEKNTDNMLDKDLNLPFTNNQKETIY